MDWKSVFHSIEANCLKTAVQNEDDYIGEDGLLYCGNCHTKKQCRVQVFGEWRTPPCLCECQKEKRDAEQKAYEHQERMRKLEQLRDMGFPDEDMRGCTFANDDGSNEKISAVAHNYVENFDEMFKRGKGLLLFGGVGTGKSFISACIANALIDRGRACLVTNFARLVRTVEETFDRKQEYLDGLNRFDLLVIDDLASERDTEYMGEIVHDIINSRYLSGLPLIVTTNLTSEELKKPADMRKQRIYSRLFEMCIPVEVTGKDRRKQKLKAEYNEMKHLLGLDVAESNN